MSARDHILTRLREGQATKVAESANFAARSSDDTLFLDRPVTDRDLATLFVARLTAIQGECRRVPDVAAAAVALHSCCDEIPGPVLAQSGPLVQAVLNEAPEWAAQVVTDEQIMSGPSPALATYGAGISEATCLVARTGSVILTAAAAGGRRLSVLPPVHLVVATVRDLVPSLEQGIERVSQLGGEWSYATVISGPSRTADIEKILVLGAHGPKRLVVVLIDQCPI